MKLGVVDGHHQVWPVRMLRSPRACRPADTRPRATTGHRTLAEIEFDTRDANQRRLMAAAMDLREEAEARANSNKPAIIC